MVTRNCTSGIPARIPARLLTPSPANLAIADLLWTLGMVLKRLETHVRKDHAGLVDKTVIENGRTALINGTAALHMLDRTPTVQEIDREVTRMDELVALLRTVKLCVADILSDDVMLGSPQPKSLAWLRSIADRVDQTLADLPQ